VFGRILVTLTLTLALNEAKARNTRPRPEVSRPRPENLASRPRPRPNNPEYEAFVVNQKPLIAVIVLSEWCLDSVGVGDAITSSSACIFVHLVLSCIVHIVTEPAAGFNTDTVGCEL